MGEPSERISIEAAQQRFRARAFSQKQLSTLVKVDQARRLKDLEQENAKLKRLVSELSLEKLVLKDIASGNF